MRKMLVQLVALLFLIFSSVDRIDQADRETGIPAKTPLPPWGRWLVLPKSSWQSAKVALSVSLLTSFAREEKRQPLTEQDLERVSRPNACKILSPAERGREEGAATDLGCRGWGLGCTSGLVGEGLLAVRVRDLLLEVLVNKQRDGEPEGKMAMLEQSVEAGKGRVRLTEGWSG